jgi:hypothetical protein
MYFFGQINWEEMLGDLMVTTFLILLAASIVVVCLMVMFPLIDLAFKKAKPAPAQVEPWHRDGLIAHHAQLSGPPWLAMRSNFLRPAAQERAAPDPLVGMVHQALAYPPPGRITFLIGQSLVPKGSDGAPPLTPLISNCGRASETLSSGNLFSAKGRPGPPGDPNKEEPGRPSCAA